MEELSLEQHQILLVFRKALRQYLAWSAQQAAAVGLTSQQHQLLLAIRGHPGPVGPSIREVSEYLLLRHHTTGELTDRCVVAGLVVREEDPRDQRVVRLRLTPRGRELVERLGVVHLQELTRVADALGIGEEVLERLARDFAKELGGAGA